MGLLNVLSSIDGSTPAVPSGGAGSETIEASAAEASSSVVSLARRRSPLTDDDVRRFLRARRGDVVGASEKLRRSEAWRQRVFADQVHETSRKPLTSLVQAHVHLMLTIAPDN